MRKEDRMTRNTSEQRNTQVVLKFFCQREGRGCTKNLNLTCGSVGWKQSWGQWLCRPGLSPKAFRSCNVPYNLNHIPCCRFTKNTISCFPNYRYGDSGRQSQWRSWLQKTTPAKSEIQGEKTQDGKFWRNSEFILRKLNILFVFEEHTEHGHNKHTHWLATFCGFGHKNAERILVHR